MSTSVTVSPVSSNAPSVAFQLWADSTTSADSPRRADLVRDKRRMVGDFFRWTPKKLRDVTAIDVKAWQAELEARGLSTATVYGYISRLSSFFNWALQDPRFRAEISHNPVTMARPKAPKPYQSEKTKALPDDDLRTLLAVVRKRSKKGDLVGLRDYALLLTFALTGYRRAEVLQWRGRDVRLNGKMTVETKLKGGDRNTRELNNLVRDAVRAYLVASGRDPENLDPDGAIWLSHDRGSASNRGADHEAAAWRRGDERALSSHAFAKNLKAYAKEAGLGDDVHIHTLRHTFAGMVFEASGGDLGAAQYELCHRNQQTTRLYVHRVAVRKDRYSAAVAAALGLED